jgi:hypothetical protein
MGEGDCESCLAPGHSSTVRLREIRIGFVSRRLRKNSLYREWRRLDRLPNPSLKIVTAILRLLVNIRARKPPLNCLNCGFDLPAKAYEDPAPMRESRRRPIVATMGRTRTGLNATKASARRDREGKETQRFILAPRRGSEVSYARAIAVLVMSPGCRSRWFGPRALLGIRSASSTSLTGGRHVGSLQT